MDAGGQLFALHRTNAPRRTRSYAAPCHSTPIVADYMAKNKRELRDFFRMREAVFKALGNQAYVVNPKRCLCPFIRNKKHSACKTASRATVDLNRAPPRPEQLVEAPEEAARRQPARRDRC